MTCPRCASPVDDGSRFCASCGAPLGDPTTAHVPVPDDATTDVGVDGTRAIGRGGTVAVGGVAPDDDTLFGDDDVDILGDDDVDILGDDDVDATPDIGAVVAPAPVVAPVARPSAGVGDGTVVCSACGATNSSARMLCGRCGVDLATGEAPVADRSVVQPGPAVDIAGDVDVAERGDGPRTAFVVAAIVVIGALVGVGVGIWAVNAGGTSDEPRPVFDAAVYPGDPTDLTVSGVGASSTAADDRAAPNMVDGDLATWWSHDPAAQAASEVDLAFALDQPSWVTAVVVANGAQAEAATFAAGARVRSMLLVVDGEPVAELRLQDLEQFQRVDLPSPVLAQTVRFQFVEVYPGGSDPAVSLSEVAFIGHEAVGADRARATAG